MIEPIPELMYKVGDRYDVLHKMLKDEMSPEEIDKVLPYFVDVI